MLRSYNSSQATKTFCVSKVTPNYMSLIEKTGQSENIYKSLKIVYDIRNAKFNIFANKIIKTALVIPAAAPGDNEPFLKKSCFFKFSNSRFYFRPAGW